MVFHWILSDSKSPQVSRTRLRILAVLSHAVIWVVSTRLPTSKSSRPFNNPLVIVPKSPITIGTIVTFMFHSIFNSLARSRYLSFFSHSFRFILWSAGTAKSTILQILFFLLIIIRSSPHIFNILRFIQIVLRVTTMIHIIFEFTAPDIYLFSCFLSWKYFSFFYIHFMICSDMLKW